MDHPIPKLPLVTSVLKYFAIKALRDYFSVSALSPQVCLIRKTKSLVAPEFWWNRNFPGSHHNSLTEEKGFYVQRISQYLYLTVAFSLLCFQSAFLKQVINSFSWDSRQRPLSLISLRAL